VKVADYEYSQLSDASECTSDSQLSECIGRLGELYVGQQEMKGRRFGALIGGLVLGLFGVAGLLGLSSSISQLSAANPKLPFSAALGHVVPHLFLLLCWPAAVVLLLSSRRKRKLH
jgi:hypothetical protein